MLSKGRHKGFNRTNRIHEITKQEQLILQRKKEIEERLKSDQKKPVSEPGSEIICASTSKEKIIKESAADDNLLNKFKNDGSFMERFRQLQKKQPSKHDEPSNQQPLSPVKISNHVRECPGSTTDSSPKTGTKSKLPVQIANLWMKESSLQSVKIKSETEDDTAVSSPEEKSIRFAIEKTAIAVAVNGFEAECRMKESMTCNTSYKWLKDVESSDYKYYLHRVEELRNAKRRAEGDQSDAGSSTGKEATKESERKRPRKSRWSEPSAEPISANIVQDPSLIQYAIQVYGKTDLTAEQWRQLEDQRKMRVLFNMMQEKQKNQERLANAGKVKYEYDSDEEAEGGTWEHKRRLVEMENTQRWAEALTEHSKGKHHLGDFLPSEELEKFMTKWEAVKDGKTSLMYESDYQNFKLQSDNIGYQMLKKLGWCEGSSLGANSDGITAPINKNAAGFGNAGLGQQRPDELQAGDDEYDQYRKRMMLAYRFRPNPLNNPRRSYY